MLMRAYVRSCDRGIERLGSVGAGLLMIFPFLFLYFSLFCFFFLSLAQPPSPPTTCFTASCTSFLSSFCTAATTTTAPQKSFFSASTRTWSSPCPSSSSHSTRTILDRSDTQQLMSIDLDRSSEAAACACAVDLPVGAHAFRSLLLTFLLPFLPFPALHCSSFPPGALHSDPDVGVQFVFHLGAAAGDRMVGT